MPCFLLIIGFIGVVVAIVIIQDMHKSGKQGELKRRLSSLEEFSPSQQIMGADGDSGLAVDENRKKICLIKRTLAEGIKLKVLTYRDILSSEIFEDGNTIIKTSRSSQLGGALIGGIALGGVGAIIGGLSGTKISSNKVKKNDLRITVDSMANPIHDINFMNMECKKSQLLYISAMEQSRHWHGLLTVIIERRAKESDSSLQKETVNSLNSAIKVEICKNCDKAIGKLEQAHIYKNDIVCQDCYNRLSHMQ
jgi:hypothetical protein